jgi:hypothetical protein
MDSWDPIGVRDVPEAQDEYDRYAGEVYVMLMDQRATEQAIASYLFDISVNHLCLSDRPRLTERSARTAALLIELRPTFETH